MPPQPVFDANNHKKILFDGAYVGMNPNFVTLAVFCGNDATVYAMIPEDARSLAETLIRALQEFEQKHRSLQANNRAVVSPFQLKPHGDNLQK